MPTQPSRFKWYPVVWVCCLMAGGIGYAEEAVQPFDPTLVSWEAGRGSSIPDPDHGAFVAPPPLVLPAGLEEGLFANWRQIQVALAEHDHSDVPPGRLEGGVIMRYESVRIAADIFNFWQLPLETQPAGRSWPRRVYLESGENGPEVGRVHIDSRQTQLPRMNVKGLLRPKRVTIDRIPVSDSNKPVTFFMLLEQIDAFKVQIRGAKDLWQTVTGEADYLFVEIHADQLEAGLSDPRVAALHLLAQENSQGVVPRDERVQLTYWHPSRPARVHSRLISLYFDDQGRLQRMDSGKDTTMEGLPAGSKVPEDERYGDTIPAQ